MEKLSGKQSGERKDGYGNILYPGDCTVAQLIEIYFNYKGNIGPVTRSGY